MESKNSVLSKVAVILLIGFLLIAEFIVLRVAFEPQQPALNINSPNAQTVVAYNLNPPDIADMVEAVSPSVVNIETQIVTQINDAWANNPFFRQYFGDNMVRPREYTQSGIGTGFIISEDGYIVTNQHVIENATEIKVMVSGEKNKFDAVVVGQDAELDLAVLKINGKLTPIPLGDSENIRVGEWVVAIGNPYGLDHTVTSGVISATGRPIKIGRRVYRNLIQTDAAINPGNSGGPLLNYQGQVVGINTAVSTEAQGIGFAISINTAKEVLNELIQTGKISRPYMGVTLIDLTEQLAEELEIKNTEGSLIFEVIDNSPAAKAGLKKNDVITAIDGEKVDNPESLLALVASKTVGQKISVEYYRNQQSNNLELVLGEKP